MPRHQFVLEIDAGDVRRGGDVLNAICAVRRTLEEAGIRSHFRTRRDVDPWHIEPEPYTEAVTITFCSMCGQGGGHTASCSRGRAERLALYGEVAVSSGPGGHFVPPIQASDYTSDYRPFSPETLTDRSSRIRVRCEYCGHLHGRGSYCAERGCMCSDRRPTLAPVMVDIASVVDEDDHEDAPTGDPPGRDSAEDIERWIAESTQRVL